MIEDIDVNSVRIKELDIPPVYSIFNNTQSVKPFSPPVTVEIGIPIVDIPGCVETRQENNGSKSLFEDDPEGVMTLCDSGIPSFNPPDYDPLKIIPTPQAPSVDTRTPSEPKTNTETNTPQPSKTPKIECPTEAQRLKEPVGTYVEGFRKKVTDYKLIDNICVQITEEVPLPEQIVAGLPSGGQVMQVGGVAVIATASALLAKPLADILLKAVKPTVKKVMKKIAAIRGKKPPVLSAGARRAEQRQMNHAVKALRSVFPRRKKRRKG